MNRFATMLAVSLMTASPCFAADWTPTAWTDEDTIEYKTDCPDEGDYWSPVWLVVLDGELYVSFGSKAAERYACATTTPIIDVRIAGLDFPGMTFEPVQELGETIDAARSDKYFTNMFLAFAHHDHYRVVPTPKVVPASE